jgi:uncharacterized membrane-anchored protein
MNNKKILFAVFVLVALVQLYVPAKIIWDREEILKTGSEFKFKTVPIDPSDPFRGKYITLSYIENTVKVENENDWTMGEKIYVHLTTTKDGFAKVQSVSKEKPTENQDYLEAKVYYVSGNAANKLTIDYPFDRFYMEESKAHKAEIAYRQSQRDTSKMTYAVVRIKKGVAVLKDIMVDGIPIGEIVNPNNNENHK